MLFELLKRFPRGLVWWHKKVKLQKAGFYVTYLYVFSAFKPKWIVYWYVHCRMNSAYVSFSFEKRCNGFYLIIYTVDYSNSRDCPFLYFMAILDIICLSDNIFERNVKTENT